MYRILVVDDEVEIGELIKLFLEKKDFMVTTVNSGEAALSRIEDEAFDLIILDKKMPGLSGMDVFWELKNRGINIPCIILTGSRRVTGYDEEADKLGYADLLFKPVDLNILMESINRILGAK